MTYVVVLFLTKLRKALFLFHTFFQNLSQLSQLLDSLNLKHQGLECDE